LQDKDVCEGSWSQRSSRTDETADSAAQEGQRYRRAESQRIRATDCQCHEQDSGLTTFSFSANYEGRSQNKLQNGAIPLIFKIGNIRNIRFVDNLILNIQKRIFFDDDVIIVTSSGHRTVYLCIIYSTSFLS